MYALTRSEPNRRTGAEAREAHRLPHGERELVEQIEDTLDVLQGKWKVRLLFLMARGVHRHCRLLEGLPGASKKMMTDTLRALECDGLATRRIYAEVPPRVEYSLTKLGWAITDPLMGLAEWYDVHGEEVRDARRSYGRGVNGDSRRQPAAQRREEGVGAE